MNNLSERKLKRVGVHAVREVSVYGHFHREVVD